MKPQQRPLQRPSIPIHILQRQLIRPELHLLGHDLFVNALIIGRREGLAHVLNGGVDGANLSLQLIRAIPQRLLLLAAGRKGRGGVPADARSALDSLEYTILLYLCMYV